MTKAFKLTDKQSEALKICAGSATWAMLFGGSRSGKTFLLVRNVVMRALKAPNSRHAIFRFRANHIKASVFLDTFPKVMRLCFTGVEWQPHTQEMYVELPNGSQIWFAGLDDKERTEKILGMEFATLYFNESSQIPWASVLMAITRLAQLTTQVMDGAKDSVLKLRVFLDCNPPQKSHWTYRLFIEKRDPVTREPLPNPHDYASIKLNPTDNKDNLNPEYMAQLDALPPQMRARFRDGVFADDNPNQLFKGATVDTWRVVDGVVPDMVRVVVGVDPSGADDTNNADNDAIGIVVCGLGTDGNAYLLEDCTIKAGPATWGRVAGDAYERHAADLIVAENNFGGAMVRQTIMAARPRTNVQIVTASRGKVQRAEPFSVLYEQGKVRHVGVFPELEEELSGFSTAGYVGSLSPNRADALVWCLASLFPAITAEKKKAIASPMPIAHSWG